MKKFKLHQIHLTDEERDLINAKGHDAVPKHLIKCNMNFGDDIVALAKEAFDKEYSLKPLLEKSKELILLV